MSTVRKAASKGVKKADGTRPAAITIGPAHVKKLHKALRDAGFDSHALKSIRLEPAAAAAPAGCHMVCTTRPDGTLDCRMVCP